MAVTTYNFPASAFANGAFNELSLQSEIQASAIVTAIDGLAQPGDGSLNVRFKAALSAGDETTLNGLVAAHQGLAPVTEKKSPQGHAIIAPYAFAVSEEKTKFKSYLYTATAGAQSVFDEVVTTQVYIQGGQYDVRGAAEGDYAEFSVVDKDDVLGLFATYGLTVGVDVLEVRKYVETEVMFAGDNRDDLRVDAAGAVLAGLYFRCTYNSGGVTAVKFKVRYLYYEV